MQVIGISNQKGGTAKTTTAVALGHDLARRGFDTVLVDLDAQGSLSPCFGRVPQPGLFAWLIDREDFDAVTVEVRPGLRLLPGDARTAEAEEMLAAKRRGRPELQLAERLDNGLSADFVILDCAPSRGFLHFMAHYATDLAVIPAQVDFLSVVGAHQELAALYEVRGFGHAVQIAGVLPTFYDKVTIESRENLAALKREFGDLVLSPVPRATAVRESAAYGKTIFEHLPPAHAVCVAYRKLTDRVLSYV